MLIVALVLLVFGSRKLPEMGSSLGKGLRSFKDALEGIGDDHESASTPAQGQVMSSDDVSRPSLSARKTATATSSARSLGRW
jgi:sec-independent protein translocase protein TatA